MKKIIIGAVLLALLIIGASFAYEYLSEKEQASPPSVQKPVENTQQRQLAPDFTVFDAEGNPVSLSDFKGKPVVANFWATWCGPCKQEMPAFEKLYKEYGDEVVFLMVNLPDGETTESVLEFVKSNGYTFPVFFDSENDASVTYGIRSIPATLFVDSEGYVFAGYAGALSEDIIREHIEGIK